MKRNGSVAISLVFALVAFSLLGAAAIVTAQEQEQSSPEQQPSVTNPAQSETLSSYQLDNLVAPIALYPDPLLGQMLVASTYPLEVVEASQWLQRNGNLKGQALIDAAKQQPWDPSVQALVAVPDALAKLNQDIQWTTDLGNAFLAQQADVMSAVQRMRSRAQADGRLASTPQQTVRTEDQDGKQIIVIQPANPEIIYVPTYDPFYIWGPPLYGYYPALYYPTFGFGFGIGFDLGYCFSGWGGWGLWGWSPYWYGHSVFVNNYFFNRYGFHDRFGGSFRGRTVWRHDPEHRLNVPYGSSRIAARFGGRSTDFRNSSRTGTRSRNDDFANANRSGSRLTGRSTEQGYRASSSQGQRYQNPPRQQYQSSRQYQSASRQSWSGSQGQRSQGESQSRYQSSQQYRSPQINRTPQIQRSEGQSRQSFQSSPQYRSAPRTSTPQLSRSNGFSRGNAGSSFSRSNAGSSFSRGNAVSSFSRGNAGSSSRSSGSFSRGNSGNFGRSGGGGSSRSGGGGRRR